MAVHKKKTNQTRSIWLTLVGFSLLTLLLGFLLRGKDVALMNPKGLIANEQYNLIVFSVALMMIIAVPTLFILYYFAWKYREDNPNAAYNADSHESKSFNAVLWAIPTLVVIILGVAIWSATHRLEPKKAIASDKKPMTIQVIALRWKWLFVYPDQKIATVNFLQVPEDTPVEFVLTADEAPMSSFWIPHWGGQLYAMTGHKNRLNLMADETGDYPGSSAEINGRGFASMRFIARASSEADFQAWLEEVRRSPDALTESAYSELIKPTENHPQKLYASFDQGLYDKVLMKYEGHSESHSDTESKEAKH